MEEQRLAVQRMQDYIEAHLYESITLADLAKASLYSPWYSYRLFAQWVNLTPADYIRRIRLSRSALKLRDQACKILDVALEMGFGSVDGYQRAFFREFGCNPREYAKSPIPLYLFTPFGVKYRVNGKENCMEHTKTIFVQEIHKPARKVLIKRGVKAADYFAYCEEVGCDIWGLLVSIKSISGEPVSMWLPKAHIKPGTSQYVQGAEVPLDYSGILPEGLDTIELPAAQYLMFISEPFEEENYGQAIEEVQAAIAKYDPTAIGFQWDDQNPRIQLEPIGTRGYRELAAIKPL
ncbi:AraC family transcriptional regulator [Oscillospiraceae bacterium MB08-C2-2]|nr:AraC family transcriptional regulator [Oscillospiraceae bacterium MB08-C2-2]